MRKSGYYYASMKYEGAEIIYYISETEIYRNSANEPIGSKNRSYRIGDFEWIDDEPIEVKRMPVPLKDKYYYLIKRKLKGCDYPFMATYDQRNHRLCASNSYTIEEIEIVSGPFSIEGLSNLKPC